MTSSSVMGPRRAIVRVLPHPSHEGSFYVEDWEQRDGRAQFTVSADHPIARHIKQLIVTEHVEFAVASTPEVEWVVRSIEQARWGDICRVSLTSRPQWVKGALFSDDYLELAGAVS